jgi:hypothetical protein
MAETLEEMIKAKYGCDSSHVESVPVHESFEGMTAWQGTVEVFDLIGHPQAKRAYAWQYEQGNKTKTLIVLKVPPVDSPETAVKVAIAAKARR